MNDDISAQTGKLACESVHSWPNCRPRILVVEEKGDLRQLTAEVLMDTGYEVDIAEDEATAWTALQLSQYDLLITDPFMPKASSVELLTKIHHAHMTLPVIMAAGVLPTRIFALHTRLRPVKTPLKPYSFQKLLALVNNVLHATSSDDDDIPLPTLAPEPRLPSLSRSTA